MTAGRDGRDKFQVCMLSVMWSPGQAGGITERSGLLLISPIIGSFTHFGLSENDRCSDLEHFPIVQKVRLWL